MQLNNNCLRIICAFQNNLKYKYLNTMNEQTRKKKRNCTWLTIMDEGKKNHTANGLLNGE